MESLQAELGSGAARSPDRGPLRDSSKNKRSELGRRSAPPGSMFANSVSGCGSLSKMSIKGSRGPPLARPKFGQLGFRLSLGPPSLDFGDAPLLADWDLAMKLVLSIPVETGSRIGTLNFPLSRIREPTTRIWSARSRAKFKSVELRVGQGRRSSWSYTAQTDPTPVAPVLANSKRTSLRTLGAMEALVAWGRVRVGCRPSACL